MTPVPARLGENRMVIRLACALALASACASAPLPAAERRPPPARPTIRTVIEVRPQRAPIHALHCQVLKAGTTTTLFAIPFAQAWVKPRQVSGLTRLARRLTRRGPFDDGSMRVRADSDGRFTLVVPHPGWYEVSLGWLESISVHVDGLTKCELFREIPSSSSYTF